ncbi:TolC family protein [Emcibacter sp. SYSU 3D8]|uniref:TolC family protein n=1 Tax=Emcibacter sp. SYSU 3D8 TaxID=3133969 RepID=UPI0031FEBA22
MPPDQGFSPVAQEVKSRSGHDVAWLRDGDARQLADALTASLLAEPLTADSATRIALVGNRDLQASFAQVATADAVQAATPRNPVLDAAMKLPTDGGGLNLDFGVAFEFIDLLFLPARSRAAEAEAEAVRLRVTGEVLALAARTRIAFVEVQAATRGAALSADALDIAQARADAANVLREAGNITAGQRAMAAGQLAQARLAATAAQDARTAARERLNILMGVREDGWRATSTIPDMPAADGLDGLERRALEASLEVAAAWQDLIALGERNGLARRVITDAEAGAVAERNEGSWEAGPSIAVPLPLFDLGGARSARARAQVLQAEDRHAAAQVRVLSAARAARAQLERARADAATSRDQALPAGREAMRQAMLGYNAMQTGIFDLLDARAAAIETKRRHVVALTAYWSASTRAALLAQGGSAGTAVSVAAQTAGEH